ncbi:DUF2793 domain-containing protein [Jannaschia ovalis]|uniref:DUF2793 domain-containing protein n=1 Tax=Jannaschia ovalis TaxID=3038773 RepID=A0ABY8LAC4_9RHOB|nr:DUF2793 domain-containing protein [Jannaschia sp. GRR-S6-38]WGH77328.1 DUF2793 domain-containing protein [Jannaschia sp. GRR-S6-38]
MTQSSERSTRLELPYIQGNQAQKHITHNEALRTLDAIVQLSVLDRLSAPPATPDEGDRWIVGPGASDAFAGREGQIAAREDGAWRFHAPRPGWLAWSVAEAGLLGWDGTAWQAVAAPPETLDQLGIATGADSENRLAVASDAVLLTHAGGGMRLKLNKGAASETASLLWQSDWSGRAEIGLSGDDDLRVKVSADGGSWRDALVVTAADGRVRFPSGVDGITDPAFGAGGAVTAAYIASRGGDLVTNGTGSLGTGYNIPAGMTADGSETPDLPAAFVYRGHLGADLVAAERVPVDPNRVYAASCLVFQDDIAGDWSAFGDGNRHKQAIGFEGFDADGLAILPHHHMRWANGGTDSLTTLAAPLAPGDMEIVLTDGTGWNDAGGADHARGVVIYGYRNAAGRTYSHYSRLTAFDLFDAAGVDRVAGRITLKTAFPASLANPDDPGGVWPVGTPLANTDSGAVFKAAIMPWSVLPGADAWYRCANHIGGIDRSGRNRFDNFAPGTASVRMLWQANFSNRPGGDGGFPDTGSDHAVRFAGPSLRAQPLAATKPRADGSVGMKVPAWDYDSGGFWLSEAVPGVTPV